MSRKDWWRHEGVENASEAFDKARRALDAAADTWERAGAPQNGPIQEAYAEAYKAFQAAAAALRQAWNDRVGRS